MVIKKWYRWNGDERDGKRMIRNKIVVGKNDRRDERNGMGQNDDEIEWNGDEKMI